MRRLIVQILLKFFCEDFPKLKSWQLGLAVNAEKTLPVVDFEMGWVNWKQENSRLKSMTLIRAF